MEQLRWALALAAGEIEAVASTLEPVYLADLDDRAAEAVSPLLAIGNLAGGEWPQRLADSLIVLMGTKEERDPGVLLLTDIRATCLAQRWQDKEAVPSEALRIGLQSLQAGDQSLAVNGEPLPEAQYEGSVDAMTVAALLRPFGLRPKHIRFSSRGVLRGYRMPELREQWERYVQV